MPLYHDEAIVLRTHKLGEADRIITMLSRSHGRVRAVAKGVRRTTSRWGSRLEPFTHVDLQLAEGRSLDVITQAETLTPFHSRLGLDYERYTAGMVMLETADRLVTEEKEPAVQQFLLLVGGLRAMTPSNGPPAPSSTPTCCARCRWPATRRRSTVAPGAAMPDRIAGSARRRRDVVRRLPGTRSANPAPETVQVLGALLSGEWTTVEAADPRNIKAASSLVSAYLSWHLERDLRSMAFVQR